MALQSAELVWLITGTSSGIGRDLALAALARGDKVIATGRGRSFSKLQDLQEKGASALELDVTAPLESLHETAKKAVSIYGRVDVLVNNAGYILVGAVEESTPEETFDQFNTNLFGALNVTRALLPYMREKRSGTIVWIGSIGGWRPGPYTGIYNSTKWAMKGISRSLHEEISPLGLRSVCIDFGYFRTSFLTNDKRAPPVSRIPDYKNLYDSMESALQAYNGKQPGDPQRGVQAVVDLIHGEGLAIGKAFPTSLVLGSDSYRLITEVLEKDAANLKNWKEVSYSTDFNDAPSSE